MTPILEDNSPLEDTPYSDHISSPPTPPPLSGRVILGLSGSWAELGAIRF
jgi:hypothetical protein